LTGQLTKTGRKALDWLAEHGGDGVWCTGGTAVLAQGEIAPYELATWLRLEEGGYVETYGAARHGGKGWGRIRLL
jgi:hypothetical protein